MKAVLSTAILAALLVSVPVLAASESPTVKCRENISMFGGPVAKTFAGNTCPKGWHIDGQNGRLATR